jgi:hypothetical protein
MRSCDRLACPGRNLALPGLAFSNALYTGVAGIHGTVTLTRPSGTLSHRMGEGRGEGVLSRILHTYQ